MDYKDDSELDRLAKLSPMIATFSHIGLAVSAIFVLGVALLPALAAFGILK